MMRRLPVIALATMLVAALNFSPVGAKEKRGLEVVNQKALSKRLIEYTVESPAMGAETKLRVLLPSGYSSKADRDYPVVYLLHGCCDDFRSWSDKTDLTKHTKAMDLVVVMPDAGNGGWYTDWYSGAFNWESYHIGELIPWVEKTFDVLPAREGRAIAGLSMGGFGAFTYASRHPDLFVAAASFSGAVDSNFQEGAAVDAVAGLDGGKPGDVFGPRATDEIRWRGHNPWDLAENLSTVDVTLRTGNGESSSGIDPLERGCWEMSTNVHNRLKELGQKHIWDDYGPGTHTWPFWERDLHKTLPRYLSLFEDPPPAPKSFTFRSMDAAYDVFGWNVQLKRPVLEFSKLVVRGSDGFKLTGSGSGSVSTAAIYKPGEKYFVTVGKKTSIVDADDRGRLKIAVDLGAANAFQAFTAPARATSAEHTVTVAISPLRS